MWRTPSVTRNSGSIQAEKLFAKRGDYLASRQHLV
jgi:hypothetical protein